MNAEEFFHEHIPLTRAMGLRVVASTNESFVLEAPVSNNSNHLGTAFGGSINALAALAGYGFIWQRLTGVEIVVGKSSIRYFRPIREVIHASCHQPGSQEWSNFVVTIERKGKARLQLEVSVTENEELAAEFKGTFVAKRPNEC